MKIFTYGITIAVLRQNNRLHIYFLNLNLFRANYHVLEILIQLRIFVHIKLFSLYVMGDTNSYFLDKKANEANMGPTWVLSAPEGPQFGPMNLSIRVTNSIGQNSYETISFKEVSRWVSIIEVLDFGNVFGRKHRLWSLAIAAHRCANPHEPISISDKTSESLLFTKAPGSEIFFQNCAIAPTFDIRLASSATATYIYIYKIQRSDSSNRKSRESVTLQDLTITIRKVMIRLKASNINAGVVLISMVVW